MDMAFINAINASGSLPAARPVDERRVAQLLLLRPRRASRGRSSCSGWRRTPATCSAGALLLALTATAVYAFAGTLWAAGARGARRARAARRAGRGGPRGRGAGRRSSATSRACGRGSRPPTRRKDYAWFDPSRVIPDTINEFPSFSFMLGDLHAHVLALPFTVLALAFAMQIALRGPRGDVLWRAVLEALAAALAIGTLYAINSWSYPVAAGVLGGVGDHVGAHGRARTAAATRWSWLGLVLVASFVLILPFVLELRPGGARDRVRARAPAVRQVARRHGADLRHPRLAAGRPRSRAGCWARRHRWRWIGWGLAAASSSARCWPPTT